MRLLLFVPLLLLCACAAMSRSADQPASAETSFAPRFPADWTGIWEGSLQVMRADQVLQEVDMRLEILPLDSGRYTWQISYGEPGADQRPYWLMPRDTSKGIWVIDERNGILLESLVQGNRFYSAFSVMGSLLFTRDELVAPDLLVHEIIAGAERPVMSGDTMLSREAVAPTEIVFDTIPPVASYPLRTVQRALLRKRY